MRSLGSFAKNRSDVAKRSCANFSSKDVTNQNGRAHGSGASYGRSSCFRPPLSSLSSFGISPLTTVRWWTTRDDFRMIKRVSNFWRSCKLIIEMNRLWEDDAFTKISQDTRYKNVPRELTDFLTRKEGAYSDLTRISVVLTKQSSFVNLDQSIRAPENMKAT
jgi:hypothetical protein